jgi:hypothetical protein
VALTSFLDVFAVSVYLHRLHELQVGKPGLLGVLEMLH